MPATGVTNPSGLQLAAYGGANCVLIAMSVPDNQKKDLAGFTIWRRREGEAEQPLLNRLNFDDPITSATTPAQRKWTSSEQAPFQKFRWVDIPPDGVDKPTTYRVRAMYFSGAGKSMHPGAEARKALFGFIDDCRKDKNCKVDVFAYDLDEQDVVAAICEIGKDKRLRAVLDNAPLHTGKAVEVRAAQLIKQAAGSNNVVQGHFSRFQHNKVFIKRNASGLPQRVLFGSMNFS